MSDLEFRLGEIEDALDAGRYRAGAWQSFVDEVSRRSPSERRSLAADIDRVSDKLHGRRGFPSFATARGIGLESLGVAIGLSLVGLGSALGSALALGAAAVVLAVTLQPLLKVSTGLAVGIGYSYFYLAHGEPRFKFRFGSYLAAPPWKRALVHLCGALGSPLGVSLAWAAARADHPTLSSVLLVLMALHLALGALLLALAVVGVRRLPALGPLRFNSAGAAGHEIRRALTGGRAEDGPTGEAPGFAKHDRYKASSYRSYNFKMPDRYDSAYFQTLCQLPLWHRTVVDELRPQLDSARILDVGCGTGSLLADMARSGANSLSGVDLAPKILEVAREKLSAGHADADLRVADVEDPLPWPAESFDVATLTGALHHFYRPHDALREIYRVLRPGGRLLVVDPCFVTPLRQLFNLYLRFLPHDGDFHFYSSRGAIALLSGAGFQCAEPRRVGLWAYLVVAERP